MKILHNILIDFSHALLKLYNKIKTIDVAFRFHDEKWQLQVSYENMSLLFSLGIFIASILTAVEIEKVEEIMATSTRPTYKACTFDNCMFCVS